MNKFCKTCGFLAPSQPLCLLTKRQVEPESDYCSDHRKQVFHCYFCNNITLKPIISNNQYLCQRCYEALGTCGGCIHSTQCDFETNPSDIPKLVQAQVRQGNAIVLKTVPNPKRTEITCAKGCVCFDPDFGCLRQTAEKYCVNHQELPIETNEE